MKRFGISKFLSVGLILLLLPLSGCLAYLPSSSDWHNEIDPHSMMVKAPYQELTPPSPGMAKVYFIRPWRLFSGRQGFTLLHIVNQEIHPIGILGNDERVGFEVTPGQHSFMLSIFSNTKSVFLDAELRPNKVYFVLVKLLNKSEKKHLDPLYNKLSGLPIFIMFPVTHADNESGKLGEEIEETDLYQWAENFESWDVRIQERLETIFKRDWAKWENLQKEYKLRPLNEGFNLPL